jgi:hypothetical protein
MKNIEKTAGLSFITRVRRRFKDRSGQSTTEYILILAIVVMIASKLRGKLQTSVERTLDKVDEAVNTINVNSP